MSFIPVGKILGKLGKVLLKSSKLSKYILKSTKGLKKFGKFGKNLYKGLAKKASKKLTKRAEKKTVKKLAKKAAKKSKKAKKAHPKKAPKKKGNWKSRKTKSKSAKQKKNYNKKTNRVKNKKPKYFDTHTNEAKKLAKKIKERNGAPLRGYKGGRIWKNIPKGKGDKKLPEKGMPYREYDLYPKPKKGRRDSRRILIGNDGSEWYTSDHYHSFVRLNK